ncbi:MAG: alpha/beta fold hydrolase [Gemmatimonadales bacterium]|nr:MAG: alpha/beta fold hydrolase [Gemmatimonadales bacterium]
MKSPPPPNRPAYGATGAPYGEAGRLVDAGGVQWHVARLGSGPPVLLLHGSASSMHAWGGVVSALRGDFELVLVDLPGHGHSSTMPRRGSVRLDGPDDVARALGALLRAEGVEPVLAAGHSAGAVLAIRAAARGWLAPGTRLKGLLLLNPAFGDRDRYLPPIVARPASAVATSGVAGLVGASLFRHLPLAETLLRSTGSVVSRETRDRYRQLLSDPARVQGVLRLMAGWDAGGAGHEARSLDIPVRILTGARDRWVPPAVVREYAGTLPVTELAARGHLLPEEDPGAVVHALRALAREAGVGKGSGGEGAE